MMNLDNVVGPSDAELTERLLHAIEGRLVYGATFRTAELRSIVGLTEDSQSTHLRWMTVCGALRLQLLNERQMYLRSVGSGSYTIITPDEQAKVAAEDEVRAIRHALNKASNIVDNTNVDMLDAAETTRHDDIAADRAARAQLFSREMRRRNRFEER